MTSRFLLHVVSATLIATSLSAQEPAPSLTPAEKKITAARARVAKSPTYADAYAELALALAMRARETSDTAFYEQGLKAIDDALNIDKTNFAAMKAQAWILLGKHEFAKAAAVAEALNKRSADDVMVYGFLSDAYTELGKYEEAEKATQWMLDLRAGNIPALTRAAHLRELFGDLDGASEFLQMAHRQLAVSESENKAWVLVQLSHVSLMQGKTADAERTANHALQEFPDYHYALGQLAKVRRAQKRYAEAVTLEQKRFASAPHAENLFVLAQSLELAGEKGKAKKAFADFERSARAEMNTADNSNHELIFYYADHAANPQEALKVARMELARRQDVYTLHAYAWALHKAGDQVQARKYLEQALRVGIRNPEFYSHAAKIALALKDRQAAKEYQQKAAQLTPQSQVVYASRQATP